MRFFLGFILLVLPFSLHAQVVINEIAWMGDSVSPNNEWIELHNRGSAAVDVSGWVVEALDGTPSISLSGTISAGAYRVWNRSVDYTGALANTGETLQLKNISGVVVDSVMGGDGWENIGGDNSTKETAQRLASNTWITASPTKGAQNKIAESPPPSVENPSQEGGNSSAATSGGSSSPKPVTLKAISKPSVRIEAGIDRTVTAGAAEFFSAQAFLDGQQYDRATFKWNFGNGRVEWGEEVFHQYDQPGTYVVIVEGITRHGNLSGTDRFVVEAKSIQVSLETVHPEYVSLINKTDREIDLSMWSLRSGEEHFLFPEGTTLFPGASVSFPRSVTGLNTSNPVNVSLLYPDGLVAGHGGIPYTAPYTSDSSQPYFVPSRSDADTVAEITESSPDSLTNQIAQEAAAVRAVEDSLGEDGNVTLLWVLIVLLVLVVAGVVGVLSIRVREVGGSEERSTMAGVQKLSADDFKIVTKE